MTEWFGPSLALIDSYTVLAANSFVQATRFPAVAGGSPDMLPGTIVRARGFVFIGSDQGAGLESQVGAFGACIVSEAAATAGGASLPDPITDSSSGIWFIWGGFARQGILNTTQPSVTDYPFDSKAMRKVEPGEVMVFIIANAHATEGLGFLLQIRMLVKLH